MAAQGADSLGVATLTLTADPAPLDAMLASSEKRTAMSMERMERLTGKRVATVGQNMSRLGNQWTRTVSLPIVGGGAAMVKVAADFEGALTQVQTQAGASGREIEGMRKAILKLAPAVGQTPVNLANALFHIESAGLRGSKALDALTQSARLAQIGHSDLTETTNALVAVMKSAPKDVKNATDAIGLMNATVGAGNLRMGDLVGALSTGIIPSAKAAGLGLRDVGAAIDVMTARGVPATDAATRLRMTISLLAAPTSKAAGELKGIGLSSTQLALDMRKPDGLVIAVQDLKKHLDDAGLSAVQQNQVIAHAFGGGRSSAGILTLLQNVGALQTAFTGIGKHSGADQVSKSWDKTQEDIGFKLDKLKAQASTAFVDIGTKIAPEFIKIGGEVAGNVEKIASAFTSLPKGAQDVIITGALAAASLGPALRLAGVLTTFVGRTWDALKVATALVAGERGLMGGPTSRALSGVGAAGAAGTGVAAAEGGAAASVGGIFSRVVGGLGLAALAAPLGIALGLAVNGWIRSHAIDEGREWADKFTAPLPAAIQRGFRDPLARARQNQEDQALLALRNQISPGAVRGRVSQAQLPTPSAADQRRTFNAYFNLGFQSGQATIRGLQSVKFTSAPILIRDFIGQLQKLPARARPEAAKTMISFAQELERQGKLPKKSVDSIIATLEQQFPQLGRFLARQGLTNDQTFAQAMKFNAATRQLKRTLSDYRNNFGDWSVSSKITAQNIDDNVATAMRHLRDSVAGSTGDARRKYKAELDTMKHATNQTFDAMVRKVDASAKAMQGSIQRGSHQAAQDVRTNFNRVEKSITDAMNAGILSTSQGSRLITRALNATLKSFGSKQVAEPGLIAQLPGPGGQHAALNAAAGGGVFPIGRPGTPGRDTIPMSVGGQDIMVGEGETAVVFNRHQIPEVNARFGDVGGLPGFFAKRKKPNYLASGGGASGWRNVVASAESLGGTGYKGNPIQPFGYSELSVPPSVAGAGSALGHLPYLTHMRIRSGGHEVVAAKQDIGAGSSFNPVMGLYPGTVAQLGLSGGEFHVSIERADGVPLTVGSGSSVGAAVASAFQKLTAPKVTGKGTIPTMVRAALGKATDAANAYGEAHMPAPSPGGAAASLFGGPTAAGAGSFDGLSVAKWIIPILSWARSHGWGGHITSGYRPGAITNSGNVSNHAKLSYPGGAVDVGDQHAIAQGEALWNVVKNYPGQPKLWAAGFGPTAWGPYKDSPHDYGHFSATGHSLGGIVRGLAGGGMIPGFASVGLPPRRAQGGVPITSPAAHHKAQRLSHHKPTKKTRKPPKPKGLGFQWRPKRGVFGRGGPLPFDSKDLDDHSPLNKLLGLILQLDGGDSAGIGVGGTGDAQKMWDLVNWNTGTNWTSGAFPTPNFSSANSPADFVITQDAQGNPVDPFISPNINMVAQQLGQAIGWQGRGVNDLEQVLKIARTKLEGLIKKAIERRRKIIARIRKRIAENLRRIKQIQAQIKAEQDRMKNQGKPRPRSHGRHLTRAQRAREHVAAQSEHAATQREKAASQQKIKGWNASIRRIKDENQALGGDRDKIGSGGELGAISDQLGVTGGTSSLDVALGNSSNATGLYQLMSSAKGWEDQLGGTGGEIDQQKLTLSGWQSNLAGLLPGANSSLQAALANATTASAADAAATDTTGPAATSDQLASLLQQQNQNLEQQLAVSQEQYRVLARLPPFGGSFLTGGMVPGALGEPRTIIAHGGETIAPAGAGGDVHETHVNISPRSDLAKLIDVRIDRRTREMARGAKPLPGARAGQLGRR